MSAPPSHLLESALHVQDLERSRSFYERVFGLRTVLEDDRMVGMELPGSAILLLCARSAPGEAAGRAAHQAWTRQNLCLTVPAEALPEWERHLMLNGVAIESRVVQAHGGTSLYFRDPDEHSVEVATPGLWPGG